MRVVGLIGGVATVLSLACAQAQGASIFQSGVPSTQGFALFPLWQQVMTDMAMAKPETIAPKTPAGKPAPGHQASAKAAASPLERAAFKIAVPNASATRSSVGCTSERTCLPAAWISFLDGLRTQSRRQQVEAVNRWANGRPYVEDIRNWGVADYWETPGQFLAHGGDCEDYAIAKYFSLVRLGFSPDDLRIVVVDDTNLNAFHAVLVVRLDGAPLLLDNQIPKVVPMDIAVQYRPIYALNERGWWMYAPLRLNIGTATISAGG